MKPNDYWNNFANLKRELLSWIQEYGTPGIMPNQPELEQAGRQDIISAIRQHGGIQIVAEQLRLSYIGKPNVYWNDFTNLKRELLSFIQEQGTPGVMPTDPELIQAGRQALVDAIQMQGGSQAVADKLGLVYQGMVTCGESYSPD